MLKKSTVTNAVPLKSQVTFAILSTYIFKKHGNEYGCTMTKKIDVLGLLLDNYTVREAMLQVEACMDEHQLYTVEVVTMQMLLEQERDVMMREVLSSLDLTVIGEKQILQAADAVTMQRVQETEANDFTYEFFRYMERSRKSVYLLGESTDRITYVRNGLKEQFSDLVFAGEYALESCGGDDETVINDINAMSPDVLISVLPSPLQEHFLAEHREKIHSSIWYGMGEAGINGKKSGVTDFFQSLMHWGRLKNSMDKYRIDEEAGELQESGKKDETES